MSTRRILVVLPPEHDGAKVFVDDVGGGHEVIARANEFPQATARIDLQIGADCRDAFTYLTVERDGYKPYRQDGVFLFAGVDRQIRIGVAPDPGRRGDTILPGLQLPYVQAKYPIVGRLRVVNGAWHDDTGPVHLLFHHDMPHLRVADENPAEADAAADAIARVGSGARILWRVADDFDVPCVPGDYWYGRSVSRACMRRQLVPALDRFAARGLKVILSMGALSKTDTEEIELHEECIDLIVRSGHHSLPGGRCTVALAEHRNEPNMTSQYAFDPPKGWALAKKTMQLWRERVGCVVTGGSWGDNDTMLAASDGMDALDYHEDRAMPECIHHIHTAWNEWIFHGKAGGKALYGGERPGPNAPYPENTNAHPHASLGGDMYVGCDDPELAWGVVAQAHFTGQGTAWLNGPGVRHLVPLDSTVLWESLAELAHRYIARDAGTWRGSNPSWRTPGDPNDTRFMYAGLAEWNQTGHPPFSIAHWQAIGPDGITDEGDGLIAIAGSWKFRLVVGTRA